MIWRLYFSKINIEFAILILNSFHKKSLKSGTKLYISS